MFIFGNATASISSYQSLNTKENQKLLKILVQHLWDDLPASIGACYANEKQSVICVTGEEVFK